MARPDLGRGGAAPAAGEFSVVYLHRLRNTEAYAARARELHPRAWLIYALADLHGLRLGRRAAAERWPALLGQSRLAHKRELLAMRLVDAVVTHATHEAALVRRAAPGARVHVVPWEITPSGQLPAFARRSGVALLGHYGHAPNVDAADWLIGEIMPLASEGIPLSPTLARWVEQDAAAIAALIVNLHTNARANTAAAQLPGRTGERSPVSRCPTGRGQRNSDQVDNVVGWYVFDFPPGCPADPAHGIPRLLRTPGISMMPTCVLSQVRFRFTL